MTNDEKLAAIKNHIEADRASSPDGKTSWDRIEDFRLKHGHLPSVQSAPCPNCFQERTDALIKLKARPTPSQDREAALREALVICEADRLKLLGDGFFEDATSKIVSAALSTHPKQPSQGTVERLKKIKALALYAVGDGNDCQCGADDSPNEAVDECWWHEVLRHTNELLASSSSLTRTEPSQDATRLDGAIRWALGETDEFPERKETDGAYWWRSELRKRAFDSQGQKP